MFEHVPRKDKLAYLGVAGLLLGTAGFLGGGYLRQPAKVVIDGGAGIQKGFEPKPPKLPSVATPPVETEVVVDVGGAVKLPGVYHLNPGARLDDAIHKAGGPQPRADLSELNLAEKLVDGSKVVVPLKGQHLPVHAVTPPRLRPRAQITGKIRFDSMETVRPVTPVAEPAVAESSGDAPRARHSSKKVPPSEPLSLNHASSAELESLPGIGPATARKILDYRAEHGAFGSIDELAQIKGLGAKRIEKLRPYLRL